MATPTLPFYVAGGTLQHDAPCYLERQADRDLYEGLVRGEFCYVLTSRQMGKSSLMVHAAARLRESGMAVALLDLTALGRNLTVEQWYGGLLDQLGRQLDLEDELEAYWLEHGQLGPLQRWMTALQEVVLPRSGVQAGCPPSLVIFVDEIDAVRSLTFSTDEFFAAIRECYNRRAHDPAYHRLTFCLLGVAAPSDLIQDTRTTPFNIGRRIELTDFTEAEAAPLAAGLDVHAGCPLGERLGVRDDDPSAPERLNARTPERLLRRILYWTGGHPYLTQRFCQSVASQDAGNPKPTIQNPPSVDRLCHELFLSPQARERDTNLVLVRERLLRSDNDVSDLLDLYARVWAGKRVLADDTNRRVEVLRLSGIVRLQETRLIPASAVLFVRNRIYHRVFNRQWVLAHTPDAELRRQRAAYRLGLLRAGALACVMIAAMSGLTLTAVRNARESRERLVRLNLYTGERAVEEGDLLSALPWFAEAARLDQGDPAREAMDRIRLAATMRQAPQIVHLWSPGGRTVIANGWSADCSRVALITAGGAAQVWNTTADTAVGPPMKQSDRPLHASFSPGGRSVYISSLEGTERVWDAASGRPATPPLRIPGASDAAFNRDGSRFVTNALAPGANGGTVIRVWNAATGEAVTPPLRHRAVVECAAFSPDGRRVVTGCDDHTAQVWDSSTGRPLTLPLRHNWWVTYVAFSPDGRRVLLASRYGGTARIWDIATGRPVTPFLGHAREVPYAVFSPDSRRVATASLDGTARVWDAGTGQPITPYLKHSGAIRAVTFSPDGRWVATAGEDRTARVWDAVTGEPLTPPLLHGGPVQRVSFRGEGRFLVTVDTDNVLRVWDLATRAATAPRFCHGGRVSSASFSADGRRILSSGFDDCTVQVQDATSGQPVAPRIRPGDGVPHAEFSPDGRRIVTACWDRAARVWDASTARPVTPPMRQTGSGIWAAFSPDGRRVVTTSDDHTARVWDAATGRATTLPMRGEGIAAGDGICQFGPDGRWVATYGVDAARIWDASTGRLLKQFNRHWGVSFSAGGKRLLAWGDTATSGGHTAAVWAVSGTPTSGGSVRGATFQPLGLPLRHPAEVTAAAFSPNGRRVVTASNGTAQVWDAATGARLTSPMQQSPSGEIGVSFSPDGRLVLTGGGPPTRPYEGADRTIRLWDAATGEPATPPLPHRSAVYTASFSPDGRRVVTGCADGTVQVWDVSPDDRPLPALLLQAQLQASRQVDRTGGAVAMTPEELRRAWQNLHSHGGSEFVSTPAQTLAWDRHEAEECERARQWSAALSYRARLTRVQPDDPALWARLGSDRAALRQWGQARAALSKAIRLGTDDPTVWGDLARVELARGDANGCRRACADLLHHFADDRDIYLANQIAWTCVLSPARSDRLAQTVVARFGAEELLDTALGAALYRADRLNEAVRRLNRAAATLPPGDQTNPALWLALCHHRLGHPTEARAWLDRAERSIEQATRNGVPNGPGTTLPLTWEQRLEMQFLLHEARALIPSHAP